MPVVEGLGKINVLVALQRVSYSFPLSFLHHSVLSFQLHSFLIMWGNSWSSQQTYFLLYALGETLCLAWVSWYLNNVMLQSEDWWEETIVCYVLTAVDVWTFKFVFGQRVKLQCQVHISVAYVYALSLASLTGELYDGT